MASARPPVALEFVQAFDVPEFAISGIACIEKIGGGWLRAYLYENRTVMDHGEARQERHVVVAIMGPEEIIPGLVRQMVAASVAPALVM